MKSFKFLPVFSSGNFSNRLTGQSSNINAEPNKLFKIGDSAVTETFVRWFDGRKRYEIWAKTTGLIISYSTDLREMVKIRKDVDHFCA